MLAGWEHVDRPLVGMLHAPALAGAPAYQGDWNALQRYVMRDAEALAAGGVDGLMLENFGDAPFFPNANPVEICAQMTALAVRLRSEIDLPLGINVLRNDGLTALAVAHASGAQFIRVNVLTGARVADQGVIAAIAHELLRMRRRLGAQQVRILADIDVKHSAPFAQRSTAEQVEELFERGGADAVIVTGSQTGGDVDLDQLKVIRQAAGHRPLWIGSGVRPQTIRDLAPLADGFIVGSSLKDSSRAADPVASDRVLELVRALRA